MTGSFYGVLGVGPDADDEEIRRAYREQVKEHHPDVSSRPGARERFKRLTTAKETLTDEHERARYDRLGHASYVREHVDSSAWTAESPASTSSQSPDPEAGARTGTSYSRSGTASRETSGAARESDPASESGVDDESGSTDRTDAGAGRTDAGAGRTDAGAEEPGTDNGSSGGSTARDGHSGATAGEAASSGEGTRGTAAGARARHGGSGTAESDATGTASGRATGTRGRARAADVGGDAGGRNSRAGSTAGARGSYARSSFWDATDPRPGRAYDPARYEDPLWERVLSGLRTLGPWVLIHAVFLSLAAGTSWFVYTRVLSDPAASPALLLVLVGEVCLAVVLSTLHVLSQLYR